MKKTRFILYLLLIATISFSQTKDTIYLIVQGDDIGSSHAANLGCIESFQNGILTVTEVIVPGPWFLQAAQLLRENPKLEVGLHLALTSEWSGYKWRPLTYCPSITDSNGYFFPMIWQRGDMPKGTALRDARWNIDEIEKELRAQIKLGLTHIPHLTHLSGHMGWGDVDPKVAELLPKLAREFNLVVNLKGHKLKWTGGFNDAQTLDERIKIFNANLEKLTPGIYIFVDHPGKCTPEMQDINHPGYMNVAEDRDMVTKVLCDPSVKSTVKKKNIKLIGYKDLDQIK